MNNKRLNLLLSRRKASRANFAQRITGIVPRSGAVRGDCWECRSPFNCIDW